MDLKQENPYQRDWFDANWPISRHLIYYVCRQIVFGIILFILGGVFLKDFVEQYGWLWFLVNFGMVFAEVIWVNNHRPSRYVYFRTIGSIAVLLALLLLVQDVPVYLHQSNQLPFMFRLEPAAFYLGANWFAQYFMTKWYDAWRLDIPSTNAVDKRFNIKP